MSSLSNILHTISYMALPLLVAIVFHEYAHGRVAHWYGDPTAKAAGRLTLNPLAHIDPFGTILVPMICLLMPGSFFIGWAKPVPIDPSRLRDPRRDMALVAAAGPAMNLLLAVVSAGLFAALLRLDPALLAYWSDAEPGVRRDVAGMLLLPIAVMCVYSVLINVLLMLFNLLPVPPLDGGRILTSLLPDKPALALARLEPYGMLIIVALIVFDPELGIIRTVTHTMADYMSGSLLSTAATVGTGSTP